MNTKNNFDDIMEAARQMQKNMDAAAKQLDFSEETGLAGDGAVKIVTNGHHVPLRVELADSLQGKDMRSLEELILTALKDVVQKVNKTSQTTIIDATQGIGLAADNPLLEKEEGHA
jgi:DNA-binding YbaB/EbfC family protein